MPLSINAPLPPNILCIAQVGISTYLVLQLRFFIVFIKLLKLRNYSHIMRQSHFDELNRVITLNYLFKNLTM